MLRPLRTPIRMLAALSLTLGLAWGQPATLVMDPAAPTEIRFDGREALHVRVTVSATGGEMSPCIDELEVYGPAGTENLANAKAGALATASSCIAGYGAHAVKHLNDGQYGNGRSWIPASPGLEWAAIELPAPTAVDRVMLSRDREGRFADRLPSRIAIETSMDGVTWTAAGEWQVLAARRGAVAPPPLPAAPPPPGEAAGLGANAAPSEDDRGYRNLALGPDARAAASSVYAGGAFAIHQVAHLIDGLGGNDHSWISAGEPSWVQVDLGGEYALYRVALGNDDGGRYQDRGATSYRVLTSQDANDWTEVAHSEGAPLLKRREHVFEPVRARFVRVAIEAASGSEARIDELEVYGSETDVAPADVEAARKAARAPGSFPEVELLRYAFLGEEHAWLKTFGRADLDPSLAPYNGRVTEYPRHKPDDALPLPPLAEKPFADADLSDPAWDWASRGVARVAFPYDFDLGPLVECSALCGQDGERLWLGIETNRLLSSHVAVVSTGDWSSWGIVAVTDGALVYRTYDADGTPSESPLEASALSEDLGCFEVAVPLEWLPGWETAGVRVGLGMGGRHVPPHGRGIDFAPAEVALGQVGPCAGGAFRVRVAVSPEAEPTRIEGLLDGGGDLALAAGETRIVEVRADAGPIGPERDLKVTAGGAPCSLHLLAYDPTARVLSHADAMLRRFADAGVDVAASEAELGALRAEHASAALGDRDLFYRTRAAKRRLFLRSPELAQLDRVLFAKRFAYHPSHIYTDYTDAPFRPGGGVCVLETPWIEGALHPEEASVRTLFASGGGIARDPIADFELSAIYFGYRPAADGFYHLMAMDAEGGNLRQITDGPYHDFYPCPLPDGDLAFISTRCASRVFCFRGGSSVLFRMKTDGSNIRPLSYASLSEWAPSVMRDGRIVWTRWEYIDKGADFTQTLWAIRPDGSHPELVFGNTIIQPNGYASGREVPGTSEISCTLVSHFGDINGPIALVDIAKGRFEPSAITSLTPEVPWPGMWPATECFRDPLPISRDLFLCSHAPRDVFGLYVIDRYGNREVLHLDPTLGSMGPLLLRKQPRPPVLPDAPLLAEAPGQFILSDVYDGLGPEVARGSVKYLRVVEEVRHNIQEFPNRDHVDFIKWYAAPVDLVSTPYGWPSFTAKADLGIVPVAEDGSASFEAPSGRVLYFQALDADFNEIQRMRSVVQLQAGEKRTCIGCHEPRNTAPPVTFPQAAARTPDALEPPSWGAGAFSYERVVQPVWDRNCISCHAPGGTSAMDLTGTLDAENVPASYRTLLTSGQIHVVDCGWNSGGCEKLEPLTFGTIKSPLWELLKAGHYGVALTTDEMRRVKTWTDLNAPLWPDYVERAARAAPRVMADQGE